MIGYKIHYGEYGYDCWGKSEWCGWYEYDNEIYLDKSYCETMIKEAKEKYQDREFEIYEVNING